MSVGKSNTKLIELLLEKGKGMIKFVIGSH